MSVNHLLFLLAELVCSLLQFHKVFKVFAYQQIFVYLH